MLTAITTLTIDGPTVTLRAQTPFAGHFVGPAILDLTLSGDGYTITLNAAPTGAGQ